MPTKIYGASDDLIEFEGDIHGEVGACGAGDDEDPGVLIVINDGTVLTAKYGKPAGGIWALGLVTAGPLFDHIDLCVSEEAELYSDIAYLRDGAKTAFAASKWERVK